ncbi:hypothetical protein [Methanobrevibacter curvatus]|uniref:Uncharacterized protein n=1 Tax=Methanobrevibacter curvatus TaxID=49547 RepID=A0A162FGE3_9EURY|nr:hypothetical protein [Methanobrevibacter curvatus]KZX12655.1 hypothetical protein MBCUR_09850 [Methanobrevibacter curvatus]
MTEIIFKNNSSMTKNILCIFIFLFLFIAIFSIVSQNYAVNPDDVNKLPDKKNISNNLGSVSLEVFGNPKSNTKIAYIIGMHPLENKAHNTLYNQLKSKSKKFKYTYYVYRVTVKKSPFSYDKGRMNGQLLAQKFIFPHAKKAKYNLVIDVHSNRGTFNGGSYKKTNFVFAPLNNLRSKAIGNKILKKIPDISYYYPSSQTSPKYCTIPLVKSGTKTIVYETYGYEKPAKTKSLINKLINTVDSLSF